MSAEPPKLAAVGATTGAAGAASTSSDSTTEPWLTLSPSLTLSSFTTPACDDGISIEALSDSTVIRLCSAFTVSPGLTSTSMMATSLKSPMSGTCTSINAMSFSRSQHDAAEVRQQRREVHIEAGSRRTVDDAVVPRQRQRQHQARLEGLAIPLR